MNNEHVDTLWYRGHAIEISLFDDTQNPITDWDSDICLIAADRRKHSHLDGNATISDFQIYENGYTGGLITRSHLDEETPIEEEDVAAFIERRTGAVVHYFVSRGYSQGDYFAGWMVMTRSQMKAQYGTTPNGHLKSGTKKKARKLLESYAETYGSWLWGDTYSYYIPDTEDSCCGYYGTNWEENGLWEAATSDIDYLEVQNAMADAEIEDMKLIELGAA